MSKTFFITIPFSVGQSKKEGTLEKLLKGFKGATSGRTMSDGEFDHNKSQLFQRVEQVGLGLRGMGLRVVPLQTQELLELYYTYYNPKASRNQRLRNLGQIHIEETSS